MGEEQKTGELVFPLIRGGVITGKIAESNGDPITGMTVHALHIVGIGRGRRVDRNFQQITDDRGLYRIPFLPVGRFVIVVAGKPWQREARLSTQVMTYPLTYFPGVTAPDDAGQVTVRNGQETRADVVLLQVPAATLAVDVAGGNPSDRRFVYLGVPALFGFRVTMGPSHWVNGNRVVIDDLAPGHYVVTLIHEGVRRGALQSLDVFAPETHVTIGETPPAQVSLAITMAGKARLSREAGGQPGSVTLTSLDSEPSPTQTVKSDGKVFFDGVSPGRYTPTVHFGTDPGAVAAVEARGAAVSGTVVTIPDTGKVELDVTVDGSAIDLNGKIACDNGGSCSAILAMLVKRSGWESTGAYRFDQTDTDGTFSWKGVAAGEYMMFAFENTDPLDYDDPAVIRELLPGAQNVTVTGDPRQTVTLQLTGASGRN